MDDPFTLSGGYSPTQFYTGSGGREHSSITISLPETIMSQIRAIVQQRTIPAYRTYQDFVRDAVHHRLQYIADNALTDNSSHLTAFLSMDRVETMSQVLDRLFNPGGVDVSSLQINTKNLQRLSVAADLLENLIAEATSREEREPLERLLEQVNRKLMG